MIRAKLPGCQTYTDLERKRQWRELREGIIIVGGSIVIGSGLVALFCWLRGNYASLGH